MVGITVICVVVLISLDVAGAFTNFADVSCKRKPHREGRIVGGVDASQGEFPWIVSIKRRGGHFCGGTIINNRWVLTAAHCLCRPTPHSPVIVIFHHKYLKWMFLVRDHGFINVINHKKHFSGTIALSPDQLRITLGEHELSRRETPASHDVRVTRMILHPDYECSRYVNDIALLELATPVPWSASIMPACFPSQSESPSFSGRDAVVAGWGWTEESSSKGIRADILQKVNLSVVGNEECKRWYKAEGKKVKILDTQICAGKEGGGKDSCWADSGGPLMVGHGADMMVVGVVSTGIGCARPRLPGLYTRISHYVNWISKSVRLRP